MGNPSTGSCALPDPAGRWAGTGGARKRRGAPKAENAIVKGMTDERRDRPAPISYRIPKGREAKFAALVAEHGGSTNAFLTDRIFGQRRQSPEGRKQVAQLLASAARISDQLHEISLAGASDSALSIEAAHRELTEIRAALLVLMGRKP